jgi:cyclopropane-fatty-acyl-phospholipid synthase
VIGHLVDSGRVPEPFLRIGIRAICAQRLREQRGKSDAALIAELRSSDIAIETDAANAQHYEVPAAFFHAVLGPYKKYSSCYWPTGVDTLGDAEAAMLELYAERAQLADGQSILDLGCGWGSFSLWAAKRFPRSRVVGISNSRAQREYIMARAPNNLEIRTCDVRRLELDEQFDRIVSIEMFEHMRNYRALFAKIAKWIAPGGNLFVHVFAHARHAYPFDDAGGTDWMAREFFTGGLMPSASLFHAFDDDLKIVEEWRVEGTHYAKTAEAWYANLVDHRDEVIAIVGSRARYHRWRVFFLACAEMFGYRDGREWIVAHYRFAPR